MAISEEQLETWSRQGSIAKSSNTYSTIKNALESVDSPYSERDYTVFLQGSYGNNTNIYSESDVDIVIVLNETYYSDLTNLSPEDRTKYDGALVPASYGYSEFKTDVAAWLKRKFGQGVGVESKSIFIPGSGSRRNADVIVAAEFHRYYSFESPNNSSYAKGICFWTTDGTQIANFPKQHAENCTRKHQDTDNYYKLLVRIIKNMRNRMIYDGYIENELAPSYFIEGLLYRGRIERDGRQAVEQLAALRRGRKELADPMRLRWLAERLERAQAIAAACAPATGEAPMTETGTDDSEHRHERTHRPGLHERIAAGHERTQIRCPALARGPGGGGVGAAPEPA